MRHTHSPGAFALLTLAAVTGITIAWGLGRAHQRHLTAKEATYSAWRRWRNYLRMWREEIGSVARWLLALIVVLIVAYNIIRGK